MAKKQILTVLLAASLLAGACATSQPFVSPRAATPPAVDAARLTAHVKHLSVDLYPRSADQSRMLAAAADYIRAELTAAGAQVEEQRFTVEAATVRNLVTRFGPKDGPLLVIGAHYDSFGDAIDGARHPKGYSPETHTPGADDNASGVAGLIELARLFAAHPPARPVELVAYAHEEPPHFRTPHMGSARHAQALKAAGREVELMLSLEMIGYFSDTPDSQHYPLPGMGLLYPTRGNFVALVSRYADWAPTRTVKAAMAGATALPVESLNAPTFVTGVDFSDHLNYWAAGYPAIMVTDTAFMRNDQYHLANDTWERLDYARMAQVVQGVYAFAAAR